MAHIEVKVTLDLLPGVELLGYERCGDGYGFEEYVLVRQRKQWLDTKGKLGPNTPLFPVSGNVPGGAERKTSKMIERDLMAAREKWIDEARTDEEKDRRLKSDFLCYANHDGLFADFHSLRHLFITNLGKAGVKPKMAQTLARHSDVRLTLGLSSHVDRRDQVAAIESLAGSPGNGDGASPASFGKLHISDVDHEDSAA